MFMRVQREFDVIGQEIYSGIASKPDSAYFRRVKGKGVEEMDLIVP